MNLSRITRLLELIGLLQSGRGHNAHSLALECGVSRRTIFRDLDLLRYSGVPLAYDEDQQEYHIPGMNFLPPTDFTAEEALSLLALCYNLGGNGVPLYKSARTAALKLESALPERLREYVRDVGAAVHLRLEPTAPLDKAAPIYQRLIDAISRKRCVRIEYDSFSEREKIVTKLSPYRLLFSRRSWYVLGRSSLHRETRTFHVGRILGLEPIDEQFRFPRGFSIERYLRNAWHMIPEPGPDSQVVVRFDTLVAKNVAEVAWHKTQKVKWLADGRLEFRVKVSGTQEISWWILGYGDQAEVIAPAALRELVIRRCRGMLARYEAPAAASGSAARERPPSKRASGRARDK